MIELIGNTAQRLDLAMAIAMLCLLLIVNDALGGRIPRIYNEATPPWPKPSFSSWRAHRDLIYSRHVSCKMDLYLPQGALGKSREVMSSSLDTGDDSQEGLDRSLGDIRRGGGFPCILFIQGQGFARVNRQYVKGYMEPLKHGFAMAAIAYRCSDEAVFPAPVHDCRDAVRFLKRHAGNLGIDGDRIGVWGIAAGGYLASLLGCLGNVERFQGERPRYSLSSSVKAVAVWSAPSNLLTLEKQFWHLFRHESPSYHPLKKLLRYEKYLGLPLERARERMQLASPYFYVDIADPPFLLHHGYHDTIVPRQQALDFEEKLKKEGVPVELVLMPLAGHEFKRRDVELDGHNPKRRVLQFFEKYLSGGRK